MKQYQFNFQSVNGKTIVKTDRAKTWKNQTHAMRAMGKQNFFELSGSTVVKILESAVNATMRSLIRGKITNKKGGAVRFVDRNIDFILETYRKEREALVNEAYIHAVELADRHPDRDAWLNCYNGAYIAWYRIFDFILGKQTRKNGKTVGRKTGSSLEESMENGLDYALPRRFENATATRIDLARACKDSTDLYILDCLDQGYTQAYAAKTLNISQQAVSKRIKALRNRLTMFNGFLYIVEA